MPRAVRSRAKPPHPDERQARVFRALADPTRRRILQTLGAGEMRAGDIAARFEVSRPAISRHLRVLREAGLLTARAEGRERRYAIAPGPLRDAAARISALDAFWRDGMARLGEELSRRKPGAQRL
jgi:DNA-binding transcriptional ArsR family regulator